MKIALRLILLFLVLVAVALWTIGATAHIESKVVVVRYNNSPPGEAFVFVPTPEPKPKPAAESNTYSNMPYHDTGKSKKSKSVRMKEYVDKYADLATKEMGKTGIPASITLAQGLLESDAGDSRLARENNNHFGMKCHSKRCLPGHCSNYKDDSHKDFFRKYRSVTDSYLDHSRLLKGARYKRLFKLSSSDYKGWARGLKDAGYATDKRYAEKLISVIETMGLQKYDQ